MSPKLSRSPAFRSLLLIGAGLPLVLSGQAMAQRTATIDTRVDRLEQEMRAVQRKVFPGGAGQVVSPEVGPVTPTPGTAAGSPATSPVADLEARVSAIEAQLARLTGQIEETSHKVRLLEESFAKLNAPAPAPVASAPPAALVAAPAASAAAKPAAATPATATAKAPPKPQAATGASIVARNEQVAAVERPSTGNASLDSYTYGYRLWSAKFYPEAQTQLQATLDKFASDPIASRTQNLLGRAYLDDGKPSMAAKVLFENYRLRPKGDRAAESLAWVGEALIQLNRLKDACLAYDELADAFGDSMTTSVRDMMTKGRVRAKCGA